MARGGFSKGTANVSPPDVEKLKPLLKHINAKPGGFHTACMNTKGVIAKYPSKEARAAVCAVLKDVKTGTTSWRKGNQKKG